MGVISWKLDIPTDLSICNNQGCVFLRVQLMIHLPWNFDTASENNISIISLPYSNQLRGILIDQREIWRHTYIKYPHLSPNYAFGITFEWFAGLKFMFSEKVTNFEEKLQVSDIKYFLTKNMTEPITKNENKFPCPGWKKYHLFYILRRIVIA